MPPYWAVRFDVEHAPGAGAFINAGAFVLADLGGPLRAPLFPASVDGDGFTTIVPPRHPATKLLPGTTVDMLGPLGRGFRLNNATRLLLVAEATQLPLLMPLLNAAPSVALVIEAPTRAQLPPPDRFPPTVELVLATCDGSTGYLGPLESEEPAPTGLERITSRLTELLLWAERACFACSRDRYPVLGALVRAARIQPGRDFAQAIIQVAMPCGVGACDVCRVPTAHGEKRACTDGPVFDLLTL